jgi:hypothetical protein
MVNPFSNRISVKEARLKKVPLKSLIEQMHITLERAEKRRLYEQMRFKKNLYQKHRKNMCVLLFIASVVRTAPCRL